MSAAAFDRPSCTARCAATWRVSAARIASRMAGCGVVTTRRWRLIRSRPCCLPHWPRTPGRRGAAQPGRSRARRRGARPSELRSTASAEAVPESAGRAGFLTLCQNWSLANPFGLPLRSGRRNRIYHLLRVLIRISRAGFARAGFRFRRRSVCEGDHDAVLPAHVSGSEATRGIFPRDRTASVQL